MKPIFTFQFNLREEIVGMRIAIFGKVRFALILSVTGIIFSLMGCNDNAGYTTVDFSKTIQVEQPGPAHDKDRTLRVAVSAMVSPKETFSNYQMLLNYFGKKLDYKIQLIQRKTYTEINELFLNGKVDLAFICSGPYATGKEKYGFEALATPIIRGEPFYHSYLIVNKYSAIKSLEDLKGRVFAFTDPESNTGALIPTYWLAQKGETPESFFKSIIYTYSHDNSILAVAKSLVDGAAVDSMIWEYYNSCNPVNTSQTRVIKKSIPFGSPPFVASKYLHSDIKENARNVLLNLHQDPEGRRILKKLLIERFVLPKEVWYQPVRKIKSLLLVAENKRSHVAP
jgi:phosphonate transport system substrate-binding protein